MRRELTDLPRPVDVHVFEQTSGTAMNGGGLTLAPNGMRVLSRLGLEEQLAGQAGEELAEFAFCRPDGSPIVSFNTRARERYGHPAVGFRRFRLRQALLAAAQAGGGVTVHTGQRLASLDCGSLGGADGPPRPAVLSFEGGGSFSADLVVGCDGLRSVVRTAVRGADEPPPRYTGFEEVVAITRDRCADLVPPGRVNILVGPGERQFGCYGVGPDCMWFASQRRPASPDSWGTLQTEEEREAARREVLTEFKGWSLVERLVQREVSVMIRVGIFDREPVEAWSRGCVVLAGDAASPIPPNLGQGGNKALEDAGVLVGALKRCNGDLPQALAMYQRLRIPRAADILNNTRAGGTISNLENPIAVWARDMVLKLFVTLNGGLPLGWLWSYDTERAVREARM